LRFYEIRISDPKTGASVLPSSLAGGKLSSLNADGSFNPAALNVELDVSQTPMHAPSGASLCRIWGLSLKDLGAAFNLGAPGPAPTGPDDTTSGAHISIFGGMSKGLPLAAPAQQGLLVKGQIFQAFGNWLGTDMTLDLILAPPTGSVDAPFNFVLNWIAGSTLESALRNTLSTVYPHNKLDISISDRLTLNHDEPGHWQTFEQMGGWLYRRSKAIIRDQNYPGVIMAWDGDKLRVSDFTGPPNPAKQILFRDLIGQPTWIRPLTIGVKCVMRGDLDLQDIVSLPGGLITNTAQSFLRFQDKTNFTGNYQIQSIKHYGNFRQPDAASWATVLEMTPEFKSV
jgi:hypothetical protein